MSDITVKQQGSTLTFERTFNAPAPEVWKYYSQQEWFEKWWGPEGWETTAKEFDFSVGGKILYDMHCTNKSQGEWFDKHSYGVMLIEEIDELSKIAYTDAFCDENGNINQKMPTIKTVVDFFEENGQTTMIVSATGESEEHINRLIEMGVVEGYSSQIEKLTGV